MAGRLGFAIVGCGMIARFHVRALAEVPGATLAALVSRHPAGAGKLIEETGIAPVPVFATLTDALKHRAGENPGLILFRPGPASMSSSKNRWKSRRNAATPSSRPAPRTACNYARFSPPASMTRTSPFTTR